MLNIVSAQHVLVTSRACCVVKCCVIMKLPALGPGTHQTVYCTRDYRQAFRMAETPCCHSYDLQAGSGEEVMKGLSV